MLERKVLGYTASSRGQPMNYRFAFGGADSLGF